MIGEWLKAPLRLPVRMLRRRRRTLLESSESITDVDDGAGDQSSRRSDEEMERGVRATAKVSDVCRYSKPPRQALLLFELVRKLKPSSCIN